MDKTDRVVVSTLMEAWEVVNAGLVQDGTVKDVSDCYFSLTIVEVRINRYCMAYPSPLIR